MATAKKKSTAKKRTPAKKKTPVKRKAAYVRCSEKPCRKKAVDNGRCADHAAVATEEAAFPIDGVVRVTELEAARFAALDAEIRNAIQGKQILDLEITAAENTIRAAATRHQTEQARRQADKTLLDTEIVTKRAEYKNFVTDLAARYKLDPAQMTVDTDTRTLRDLRGENPS